MPEVVLPVRAGGPPLAPPSSPPALLPSPLTPAPQTHHETERKLLSRTPPSPFPAPTHAQEDVDRARSLFGQPALTKHPSLQPPQESSVRPPGAPMAQSPTLGLGAGASTAGVATAPSAAAGFANARSMSRAVSAATAHDGTLLHAVPLLGHTAGGGGGTPATSAGQVSVGSSVHGASVPGAGAQLSSGPNASQRNGARDANGVAKTRPPPLTQTTRTPGVHPRRDGGRQPQRRRRARRPPEPRRRRAGAARRGAHHGGAGRRRRRAGARAARRVPRVTQRPRRRVVQRAGGGGGGAHDHAERAVRHRQGHEARVAAHAARRHCSR